MNIETFNKGSGFHNTSSATPKAQETVKEKLKIEVWGLDLPLPPNDPKWASWKKLVVPHHIMSSFPPATIAGTTLCMLQRKHSSR